MRQSIISECRIVGGKCHSHCCSRCSLMIAVSPLQVSQRHPRAERLVCFHILGNPATTHL